jgi:hypothetical protein
MRRAWVLWIPFWLACDALGMGGGDTAVDADGEPIAAGPAGATCTGLQDCASGRACVEGRCRYLQTTVRGEVLASSAEAILQSGDAETALGTYEEAIGAFENAEVPIPPEVLCGAALAALRLTSATDGRERAGRLSDRCFRGSLPGDPLRSEALRSLGRLRFDGLSLVAFDEEEPASRFFTEEPSRPTVDAIEIGLDLPPEESNPGYDELKELMQGEGGTRAIADCMVQDWEIRHERRATASLVLEMETRLRDMGDYDIYQATATVKQQSLAPDGFEPCVAGAMSALFEEEAPRLGRSARWQIPFEVTASLQ